MHFASNEKAKPIKMMLTKLCVLNNLHDYDWSEKKKEPIFGKVVY
jgi:hypothetical protein